MYNALTLTRAAGLGSIYFGAAAGTIAYTRFHGGVSCLWIATAVLTAALASRPRRDWPLPVACCAIASMVATGVWGLGWVAAIPFALINMTEALVGASLFGLIDRRGQAQFNSFGQFMRIVGAIGLVAPVVAGIPAALTAQWLGHPLLPSFFNFVAGHALGAVTFTPLCTVVACPDARRTSIAAVRHHWQRFGLSMIGFAAISILVFTSKSLSLLFLPILPLILIALWQGREATAVGVAILALSGGVATVAGSGPIHLIDAPVSAQVLFFQFYLAATVLTVLPIAAELHARRRLLRDMIVSEQRFRILAEQSSDILIQLSQSGRILYVSPSIERLGGYDPAKLVGKSAADLVAAEHHARVSDAHRDTMSNPGTTRSVDYLAVASDGSSRWFETRARALVDAEGRVDGTLSVVRDISARKEIEHQLTLAALTDQLTGLANRRAFREEIARRVERRASDGPDCIAMFDVDHFKRVNDRFGHDGGDLMLRHVADVARQVVRRDDLFARLGGEEFALLMPDTPVEQAMAVCDRLRIAIGAASLITPRGTMRVTISGGVALLDDRGLDHALQVADRALYEAKAGGRDQLALAA